MPTCKSKAPPNLHAQLLAKGWSQRAAARQLGLHWSHLSRVLNGERHSRRLLTAIAALPKRQS